MKNPYYVQVNDYMTPVKVQLTESEANTVAYVLKEIVKTDPDALVAITNDHSGDELYGNYDEWIKTHKNEGGTKMSRVDNIAKFAQKKEMEKAAKEMAIAQQIESYKEQIRALKPRIDELLAVGNACLKHNIPLETQSSDQSYNTHQFISNSWSHLCGFIREYDQDTRRPLPFTKVGKIGGGACDWNLETDGVTIDVSGDALNVLKRFVEGFDTFETEFYKYVDRITA